jgi:hypothetical protein
MKWTVIAFSLTIIVGISVGVIFAPVMAGWFIQWFTYDRHFRNVQISATPDRNQCPDTAKPILIEIRNGSSRAVAETAFWVNATRPGSSFDVSNSGQWTSDTILSGKTFKTCTPAALIGDATDEDPQNFRWSAGLSSVRFED